MIGGFLGALIGGLALGGTIWAMARTFKMKLPGWVYPAAIAGGMLAMSIYLEYIWFGRTVAELPPEVQVVETYTYSAAWQPWTFLVPRINRFVAYDERSLRTNEEVEGVVLVEVYFVERNRPTLRASQFVDCNGSRWASLLPDTRFDDAGLPENAEWEALTADNPVITSLCGTG